MANNFNFNSKDDVKILSEEEVYKGFFKVKKFLLQHRRFSGDWSEPISREVQIRKSVAAALPYDPVLDKVVLIQQFRVGALDNPSPWLLEIVAGLTEEHDRSEEDVIYREIKEESGLEAKELYKIAEYWVSPGGSNEFLNLFCARVDAAQAGGIYGVEQEQEDIYVHVLSTQDALNLLERGLIRNAITLIALQWLALNKKKIDQLWV